MEFSQPTYNFTDAVNLHTQDSIMSHQKLIIRQQPLQSKTCAEDKDKSPIDPPPIVELKVDPRQDPAQGFLHSPYLLMTCSILPQSNQDQHSNTARAISGQLTSTLQRLKDSDAPNASDGAFFIFGDMQTRQAGIFRLQFSLYEMRGANCHYITSVVSDIFESYLPKFFPGLRGASVLSHRFIAQGVKLKARREPRTYLKEKGPASDDYQPRHYETGRHKAIPSPPLQTQEQLKRCFSQQSQQSAVSYQETAGTPYDEYPNSKRPCTDLNQSQSPAFNPNYAGGRQSSVSNQGFQQAPGYGDCTYAEFPQPGSASGPASGYGGYACAELQQPAVSHGPTPRGAQSSELASVSWSQDFTPPLQTFDPFWSIPNLQFDFNPIQASPMEPGMGFIQQGLPGSSLAAVPSSFSAGYGNIDPPPPRTHSDFGFQGFYGPNEGQLNSFQDGQYSTGTFGQNQNMSAGNFGTGFFEGGHECSCQQCNQAVECGKTICRG
ncbi:uncharacterized protein L3040_004354 [Drepanopeziza brunnea f. sp. 'multigermtubi']|uniref:uncharacterized protein n=1 Tax=Drepanopeziza brunnea f. sp. 'multigermtubi' TaxID=698441 RepID=UPI00239C306F|nr:hypothetical protein L3040_004354 [Drepanopeziza brunnea f. sp. 'multigermtubi']